jgi:hypothetical protein
VVRAVITLVGLLVLRTFHIYRSARTTRLGEELYALVRGVVIVTAIASIASFFTRGELSRSMLLLFALLATLALCGSRVAIRFALRELRRHGRNLRHVLVVGAGPVAEALVAKIRAHADYGPRDPRRRRAGAGARRGRGRAGDRPCVRAAPRSSTATQWTSCSWRWRASEYAAEEEALAQLADSTAAVRLVPDLARAFTLNASVEDFDGLPVVLVTESPGQGWNAVLKRCFDLALAAIGLRRARAGDAGDRDLGAARLARSRALRAGAREPLGPALPHAEVPHDAHRRRGGWRGLDEAGDPRRTRRGPLAAAALARRAAAALERARRPDEPRGTAARAAHLRRAVPRVDPALHAAPPREGGHHRLGAGPRLRGDTPLDRRIEYDCSTSELVAVARHPHSIAHGDAGVPGRERA